MSGALRIGMGFDIHPFSPDPHRRLVLGGVVVSEGGGLGGHSDADVICHAVADAVLGAAGADDLGVLFPDSDPRWEGADSLRLLTEAASLVGTQGWEIIDVDAAVVLDAPRLAHHRSEMIDKLSEAAGATVRVKAKRAEGLGSLGRGEGIACWAVALLRGKES